MEVFPSERSYKGLFSERKGAGIVCGHSAACPVQTEARSGDRASEMSPGTEWPRVPEPRSLVPLPTGYEHPPRVPQSPCESFSFLGFQDTAVWPSGFSSCFLADPLLDPLPFCPLFPVGPPDLSRGLSSPATLTLGCAHTAINSLHVLRNPSVPALALSLASRVL